MRHISFWDWGKIYHCLDELGHCYVELSINYEQDKTLLLSKLHVNFNERKNGLANSLLEEAEKIAKNEHCERIELFCKKNNWLKGWYIRKGYEVFDECDEHYWLEKFV